MAGCRTLFASYFTTFNCRSMLSTRNILVNHNQYAGITQKTMEKLGLPEKPKRPLTPYFKFMMSIRPKLRKENPDLKLTEITKIMATEWAKCDSDTKTNLQKEYNNEMSIYLKEMINYEQSLTPQQRDLLQQAKLRSKAVEEKNKQRQKGESLGKPKRPVSGFVMFLQEHKENRDENKKYVDWIKEMTDNWKTLPEEKRKKYNDKSRQLIEQYKNNMKEWEEKMIRLGHTDVVRLQGLLTVKQQKKSK